MLRVLRPRRRRVACACRPAPSCRRRRRAARSSSAPARPRRRWPRRSKQHWPGPLDGLVVTRYGHGAPTAPHRGRRGRRIPVPDAAGRAGRAAHPRSACKGLGAGRSRAVPDLGRRLGAAGAARRRASRSPTSRRSIARCCAAARDIGEMNCVRKHLSAIKGGRLAAAAAPARVVSADHLRRAGRRSFGDRLGSDRRRSRPPSPTRCAILAHIGIDAPPAVLRQLSKPRATKRPSPAIRGSPTSPDALIATPQMSLEAAAATARAAGVAPMHPRRRDRGRGARGRHRACRHRAAGRAVTASRAEPPCVLHLGRRDDGDRARQGARRAQRRVPAGLAIALDGRAGHLRRSPATPTASTAARTTPARSSVPTRWRAPRRPASTSRGASPTTTAIRCSRRSATSSSPGRRSPTSTTSARFSRRRESAEAGLIDGAGTTGRLPFVSMIAVALPDGPPRPRDRGRIRAAAQRSNAVSRPTRVSLRGRSFRRRRRHVRGGAGSRSGSRTTAASRRCLTSGGAPALRTCAPISPADEARVAACVGRIRDRRRQSAARSRCTKPAIWPIWSPTSTGCFAMKCWSTWSMSSRSSGTARRGFVSNGGQLHAVRQADRHPAQRQAAAGLRGDLGARADRRRGRHRARGRAPVAVAQRGLCARPVRAFADLAVGRGFQQGQAAAGGGARARHR